MSLIVWPLYALSLLLPQAHAEKPLPAVPPHYIYDESSSIRPEMSQQLSQLLDLHQKATTDQIVVAVFRSLDGEELVSYSNRLFQNWKLGQRSKDNGVLLTLFLEDRKIRIEVGYGMEAVLTDADSKQIIESVIKPYLKTNDINTALHSGVLAILQKIGSPTLETLTDKNNLNPPVETASSGQPFSLLFTILILIFYFRHRLLWIFGRGATYDRRGVRRSSYGNVFRGGGGRSGGGGASGSW